MNFRTGFATMLIKLLLEVGEATAPFDDVMGVTTRKMSVYAIEMEENIGGPVTPPLSDGIEVIYEPFKNVGNRSIKGTSTVCASVE